jgi:hypothetical protein
MPPVNEHGLSEDEMALLTDEERAGLESDDDEGSVAVETGDEEEEEEASSAAAESAAAAAPAEAAKPVEESAPAAAEPDDEDDAPVIAPLASRVDAEQSQARITAIGTEKTALEDQLDNGDITTKEYTAAVDKLNDEKNGLTNTLSRQQEHDEAVTTNWYKSVNTFLDKNPELKENQTRLQSFDTVVRRITGDPENASLSNAKQLAKARDIWRAEMGYTDKGAATKEETKGEQKPAPKPKPEIPPTLHNVPAADIETGDDGKFSHLDALMNAGKSVEFETALSRLSEADQQDYLSRG